MKLNSVVACLIAAGLVFFNTGLAAAHVVVKPATASVGQYVTFTMGVPVEKDKPTTALRLVIPAEVESVTPTVKAGWKIEIKKSGEGDGAKITEISWTEGIIPPGQRDDFSFSAKVPAKPITLQWKAYQTYEDGTLVSWDQAPVEKAEDKDNDSENTGPYSQTKIENDLESSPKISATETASMHNSDPLMTWVPYIALLLSAIALALSLRKKA